MFKNLVNFKKFTKIISKDFGKLDDKLIIQQFYHINICTLTYKIYSSNLSILKIHNTCIFQSYKKLKH